MWSRLASWYTQTSELALTLAPVALELGKGLPHVLLLTCLFCLYRPRNLGLSFVPYESPKVGTPLILAEEVGFSLSLPLSRR